MIDNNLEMIDRSDEIIKENLELNNIFENHND